jgi:hypothetical protein
LTAFFIVQFGLKEENHRLLETKKAAQLDSLLNDIEQ